MQINENEIARLVRSVLGEMTAGTADSPKPQAAPQGEPVKVPTYASFMGTAPKSASCASSC